jgi:NADH-quinone oxidoreductase subunit L
MSHVAIILGGPFLAMAILGVIPALRRTGKLAGYLSILGISSSLLASLWLLLNYSRNPVPRSWEFVWAPLSDVSSIQFGVLVDGLSALMFVVVGLIALVVQIYSFGYMSEEKPAALGRYYAYHSLFVFAMLGLVASHNTLQTYAFWELVGLGSYLLIGFWFEKPEAARAATKAFWTTRLGDVGFAIGLVLLWSAGGSFTFETLFEQAASGQLAGPLLTLGVAGLFLGAMGKSAQFPLHIWLPDAMEGPTPVSALIHAATMVAAGVYLMVRITPLIDHTPVVAAWILGLGVLTALMAASMAIVSRDIKRIMAFSTVSQLGYMMAAVGAGAATAGFFHLTTHAFFKALLFLTAGSLIHAVNSNNIFDMGRLWKKMPVTGAYFLIGGLALCGLFPTSGFFSKDEILHGLWHNGHPFAFWILLFTAGLTAFYMFRVFFVVFFGKQASKMHAHEAPVVMTVPMGILAAFTLIAGFFAGDIVSLLHHSISFAPEGAHAAAVPLKIPVLGTLAAVIGFAVALFGYQLRRFKPARVYAALGPLSTLLERRYYIDECFLFVYHKLYLGLAAVIGWIDRFIIDGFVNLLTAWCYGLARGMRRTQTGKIQDALYAIAIGVLLLTFLAWRL